MTGESALLVTVPAAERAVARHRSRLARPPGSAPTAARWTTVAAFSLA